jgi:hypothetical protein
MTPSRCSRPSARGAEAKSPRRAKAVPAPSPTALRAKSLIPLLHLESEDPDKDISLYINSPDGRSTLVLATYDAM